MLFQAWLDLNILRTLSSMEIAMDVFYTERQETKYTVQEEYTVLPLYQGPGYKLAFSGYSALIYLIRAVDYIGHLGLNWVLILQWKWKPAELVPAA